MYGIRPAAPQPVLPAAALGLGGALASIPGLKEEIEAATQALYQELLRTCLEICERHLRGGGAAANKLADGWAENVDPSSGKAFYYNAGTRESRWEKPLQAPQLPAAPGCAAASPCRDLQAEEWTEQFDASSGKAYWYNSRTKESTWTMPAALQPRIPSPGALPDGWTENSDPTTGKSFYFNKATNESRWDRPVLAPMQPTTIQSLPGVGAIPDDWVANADPSTGKTFYYNAKTQESRWDKPPPATSPALPRPGIPGAAPSPMLPRPASPGMLPRPASPAIPGASASLPIAPRQPTAGAFSSSVSSFLRR
jgi:hypothetical protein